MAMTNTTVPLIRATVRAGDDGSGVSGAAVASSTMGWGVAVGDGVDVDGGAGAPGRRPRRGREGDRDAAAGRQRAQVALVDPAARDAAAAPTNNMFAGAIW